MSELGDIYALWDEEKKLKKKSNANKSTQLLLDNHVVFTSNNNGVHLVIEGRYCLIDFWPSTGTWIHRPSGIPRRGVFRLLGFIGKKITSNEE